MLLAAPERKPVASRMENTSVSKPRRHGLPAASAPADVLAARAAEALEQEKFKEAVDLFKLAIRQQPRPEWKESLADAYRGRARVMATKSIEFIPIKSSAAKGSGEPESCAMHSRFPSPDRECPASTAEAGL